MPWRPGEEVRAKAPVLFVGPTRGSGCPVTVLGFQVEVRSFGYLEGETGPGDIGRARLLILCVFSLMFKGGSGLSHYHRTQACPLASVSPALAHAPTQ